MKWSPSFDPDAGDIDLHLDDVGVDAVDGGAEGLEEHRWEAEYTGDRPGRKGLFYSIGNSHRGTEAQVF